MHTGTKNHPGARGPIVAHWATAELWRAVLEQDAVWIPLSSWDTYALCSVFELTPAEAASLVQGELRFDPSPIRRRPYIQANLDVPGATQVATMGTDYRLNVGAFLQDKAVSICSGLSWAVINEPASIPEDAQVDLEAEAGLWAARATDPLARSAWFDALPLIKALRA